MLMMMTMMMPGTCAGEPSSPTSTSSPQPTAWTRDRRPRVSSSGLVTWSVLSLDTNDFIGAHNKNEPEIEARVSKIDVPSTWDMDEDFGWNVSDGPDAAVSVMIMMSQYSKLRCLCLDSHAEAAH